MDSDVATPAGVRVNSIVLAFTLVAGMVVFLRMFTRFYMSKRAGFEDACIGFAMASSIALAVMASEQVMHGLGKRTSRLTEDELDVLLKAFWASVWIYNLTLTATKVAILVQYIRIFPVQRFRLVCFLMLGAVVAYGAWAVASSILICTPVPFSWDKSIENGQCMDQLIIWFTNAGVNIAQDVVIFFMPFGVIRTLQIPKSQKKGLNVMFALGASVTLVSIIRLHALDQIANSTDVSFDNTSHLTLSAVEANVGIICACLPAMRPLLARSLPGYFSEASQYGSMRLRDIERPKHEHHPSTSTRTNTARTETSRTVTPRVPTLPAFHPQNNSVENFPLQPLQPSLSRTPSGRFSVTHSRPPPSGLFYSPAHARTTSKSSTSSTTRAKRPPLLRQPSPLNHSHTVSKSPTTSTARKPRFQGRLDPLRMSPVTPLQPPVLPAEDDAKRSSPLLLPPRTPGADKRLPITPFPGQGDG